MYTSLFVMLYRKNDWRHIEVSHRVGKVMCEQKQVGHIPCFLSDPVGENTLKLKSIQTVRFCADITTPPWLARSLTLRRHVYETGSDGPQP